MTGTLPTELGLLTSVKYMRVPLRPSKSLGCGTLGAARQPARWPGNVTALPPKLCRHTYGNTYRGSFPSEIGLLRSMIYL